MSETDVDVVEAKDINRSTVKLERHPGLLFRELIGPEAKISSAGPIIGMYDAMVQPGEEYWPRENEEDVERLVFVQGGKGHLSLDDEKYNVRSGSLLRIHQGEQKEAHIRNTGDDPIRLFIIIFENDEKSS